MNADIPPLKVTLKTNNLTGEKSEAETETGYAFAIQSYKGRALQFHVLMESGAHFRHVPLHWLQHDTVHKPLPLNLLQLWDCFSYKPVVTVFDFIRDYECQAILKDKSTHHASYWFTVDWLPDSDSRAGVLLEPEQNKCCHVVLLANGQVAALPTNRLVFKDAFFIGNKPTAATKGYATIAEKWTAESCERWSVAETDEVFY